MAELEIQKQIDDINRKLDFLIEEVMLQKQARESREDLIADLSIIGKDVFSHTVEELDKAGIEFDAETFVSILVKLVRHLDKFDQMIDMIENVTDLVNDVTPILHQMGLDAINKMAEFERKGYIDFVKEIGKIGENVMTHFTVEDVKELADNIVPMLETVKRITQPDMLVAVNNAITVYGSLEMEKFEEFSMFKALKELRSPEMKKGLGFMINFMKNLAKQQEMQQSINKNNIYTKQIK